MELFTPSIFTSVMQQDYALTSLNTFGVNVRAELYAEPSNLEDLQAVLSEYDHQNLPFLVLGEGSNILFTGDFPGLVLRPLFKGMEVLQENSQSVLVKVGAGENWDDWVEASLSKGWFGLENLSLIPGSVGSSPIQNIGAYGKEIREHIEYLEAWDLVEGKQVILGNEECRFGYRNSIFKGSHKNRYIITHVVFRLGKTPDLRLSYGNLGSAFEAASGKTPNDLRKVVVEIRRQKLPDPSEAGNAGSFFKNPLVDRTIFKCIRVNHKEIPHYPEEDNQVKIPAAWLIQQAGWKGRRVGNVGTWPNQPLVIVNHGGATGQEILAFSKLIQEDVDRKFGVFLEREVNVI